MDFFCGKSFWIAPEDSVPGSGPAGRVMLFRRRFQGRGRLIAAVSADSEYRLFCNGQEVLQGPAFCDEEETFYDRCDLSSYLLDGENEILAEVVGFAAAFPDFFRGGAPMARMALRDAFILDGTLICRDGSRLEISTGKEWEAAAAPDIRLFRCADIPAAGPGEMFLAGKRQTAIFSPAQVIEPGFRPDTIRNSMLHYYLTPKRIPDLQRKTVFFCSVFDASGVSGSRIRDLLAQKSMTVPAGQKAGFVLALEQETTGRLQLSVLKGTGSMDFYYAENLLEGKTRHFSPARAHEVITGPMHDRIELGGTSFAWKSYFYRAFRFVRVEITAGNEPVEFRLGPVEQETYPYEWKGDFVSGSETLNRLWEISRRTLALCSHHIYEDCPCYERLQYAADSRIASQVAWLMTGDTRLTEQAIRHFRHSIRAEGLTAGSYPSRSPVILPLWSLHFVMLVEELFWNTGNKTVLEENFSSIRRILEWFLAYRQPEGGIGKLPRWNMADFSPQWSWNGEPPEVTETSSAYVTFFTAECLFSYGKMAETLGKADAAAWARDRYGELCADGRIFYDETKSLYADTPGGDSFSLLTNAQALLAGMPAGPELLRRAYDDDSVKRAALFGGSFIFKAFMQMHDPEYAEKVLLQWEKLLIEGRTVFPEGTPVPRSECHVWSALPGIGLICLYTGFRIEHPGAKVISFSPYACGRIPVRGKLPLPDGTAEFDFNGHECRVKLPTGTVLRDPDGRKQTGTGDWMEIKRG